MHCLLSRQIFGSDHLPQYGKSGFNKGFEHLGDSRSFVNHELYDPVLQGEDLVLLVVVGAPQDSPTPFRLERALVSRFGSQRILCRSRHHLLETRPNTSTASIKTLPLTFRSLERSWRNPQGHLEPTYPEPILPLSFLAAENSKDTP